MERKAGNANFAGRVGQVGGLLHGSRLAKLGVCRKADFAHVAEIPGAGIVTGI